MDDIEDGPYTVKTLIEDTCTSCSRSSAAIVIVGPPDNTELGIRWDKEGEGAAEEWASQLNEAYSQGQLSICRASHPAMDPLKRNMEA